MDMTGILPVILDRLIDLWKTPRKQQKLRFDQIWKPTYQDLERVHADYYAMFQTVLSFFDPSNTDPGSSDKAHQTAIQYLKKQRVALAPVRQKTAVLETLLHDHKQMQAFTEEEKAFLYGVVDYIRGKSMPDFVGSRSAALQDEIQQIADKDEIAAERVYQTLDDRIDRLTEDWKQVSSAYNRLQLAVIQKSA